MSKIKLCCLLNPMELDKGFIKLFDMETLGKPVICKQCHDDLIDSIPEGIRAAAASRGVWEAISEYMNLKFKQEFIDDDI